MSDIRFYPVMVCAPVHNAYTYAVEADPWTGDFPAVGTYVRVPFGGRHLSGVIWGEGSQSLPAGLQASKIKSIVMVYHTMPPMSLAQRNFVDWVASYTVNPAGYILKMCVNTPEALFPESGRKIYDFDREKMGDSEILQTLSPKARALLETVPNTMPSTMSEGAEKSQTFESMTKMAQALGCSPALLRGLVAKGVVRCVEARAQETAPCVAPDYHRQGADLSLDQRDIADRLKDCVQANAFHALLLDGVTGSGKTEVYFEAIAQCVSAGRQVLLMLPEIALSNAFLSRFQSRFGCAPALWHSRLSPALRRKTWRGVACGQTKVDMASLTLKYGPFIESQKGAGNTLINVNMNMNMIR